MANQKNLKPWKKGQSGNPNGAKLHNKDLKAVKHLSREEIAEMGALLLSNKFSEIEKIAQDKESNGLKFMVARVVTKTALRGDASAMAVVLEQIAGKMKERVEMTGADGAPLDPLAHISTVEIVDIYLGMKAHLCQLKLTEARNSSDSSPQSSPQSRPLLSPTES